MDVEPHDRPTSATATDARVLSHLAIRQLVGLIGFALPTALYLYARLGSSDRMQPSISEFYYTAMGDVMVGALVAIGVFLLAYRGYAERPAGWPLGDRGAAVLAGIGAIGTALFPTTGTAVRALCYGMPVNRCAQAGTDSIETGPVSGWGTLPDGLQNALHFGSAALFLGMLAYFCLVLFPIGPNRNGKPVQARTYQALGVAILVTLVAIIILKWVLPNAWETQLDARNLTFWLETIAVFAFSAAWLMKGKPLRHPLGLNAPQPQV
jgi:hypothetical protein